MIVAGILVGVAILLLALGLLTLRPERAVTAPPVIVSAKPLTLAERKKSQDAATEMLAKFKADEERYVASFRGKPEGASVLGGYTPGYGTGDAGKL